MTCTSSARLNLMEIQKDGQNKHGFDESLLKGKLKIQLLQLQMSSKWPEHGSNDAKTSSKSESKENHRT